MVPLRTALAVACGSTQHNRIQFKQKKISHAMETPKRESEIEAFERDTCNLHPPFRDDSRQDCSGDGR